MGHFYRQLLKVAICFLPLHGYEEIIPLKQDLKQCICILTTGILKQISFHQLYVDFGAEPLGGHSYQHPWMSSSTEM